MNRWEQHSSGAFFGNASSSSSVTYLTNQPTRNEQAHEVPTNPNPKPLAAQTPEEVIFVRLCTVFAFTLPLCDDITYLWFLLDLTLRVLHAVDGSAAKTVRKAPVQGVLGE